MAANDRTVLLQLFEEEWKAQYPTISKEEFFESYVPFNFLKDFELDYDDIELGVVDGPNDGGVDGVYAICDGSLIDDIETDKVRKHAVLTLAIFSTKFIASFKLNVLNNLRSTLADLLDLDEKKFNSKKALYKPDLVDAFDAFRQFYKGVASRFPKLRIFVVYATASPDPAADAVLTKLESIASDIREQFSAAEVEALALDARALLDKVREPADEVRPLEINSSPISEQKGPSYVALANIKRYYQFICLPNGNLNSRLFDDNVRDYEGDVNVNKEIKQSLAEPNDTDFWWLNNGVSVICDAATLSGNTLQIKNPKIVNGLQTSYRIHEHFSPQKDKDDDRKVLVRVICATDDDLRSNIVRATNRQTPISDSQLKTTAAVHRNIELYLKEDGLFYERRKNYWRNQGKKRSEIVTVTDLAQAVMTVAHGRPHTARARPGTLLTRQTDPIFDESFELELYSKAIELVRRTEVLISNVLPDSGRRDRNNIKYHVVAKVVRDSAATSKFTPIIFAKAKLVSDAQQKKIIKAVYDLYSKEGASDKIAKSEDFWIKVRKLKVA